MSDPQYEHKLTQHLWEFYQEWMGKLKDNSGLLGMLLMATAAEIPSMLANLDQDDDAREGVRKFLQSLADVVKECEELPIEIANDTTSYMGIGAVDDRPE